MSFFDKAINMSLNWCF